MSIRKPRKIQNEPVVSEDAFLNIDISEEKPGSGGHTSELRVQDESGNVSAGQWSRAARLVIFAGLTPEVLERADQRLIHRDRP
ncbi:hypothetical protein GF1_31300 [Desulfolithobacter dissulfuricans]|uniref:Uncharacterized protein n=1 Tax=Desulfolithobacter dissulfuricans TaxID=2795293 RepID=A0A915U3M7_9BACT|nr:hypothetical protein [Desulfolithobacter dissulfuricans]BCO10754.1 hypothetical protein GF1_31300 [Desulfolithobacter dissulfuricans]